jgi:hypothetical protein
MTFRKIIVVYSENQLKLTNNLKGTVFWARRFEESHRFHLSGRRVSQTIIQQKHPVGRANRRIEQICALSLGEMSSYFNVNRGVYMITSARVRPPHVTHSAYTFQDAVSVDLP